MGATGQNVERGLEVAERGIKSHPLSGSDRQQPVSGSLKNSIAGAWEHQACEMHVGGHQWFN